MFGVCTSCICNPLPPVLQFGHSCISTDLTEELCSHRISCFHAFWCFPRPILTNFHIAYVFLAGFPLFFSIILYVINNEVWKLNVKNSIEVQDEKTGLE